MDATVPQSSTYAHVVAGPLETCGVAVAIFRAAGGAHRLRRRTRGRSRRSDPRGQRNRVTAGVLPRIDERRYGVSRSQRPLHETNVCAARPTFAALRADGPHRCTRIDVEVVESRPPRTLGVPDDSGPCRYCLAEWTQAGPSANYTFLYRV